MSDPEPTAIELPDPARLGSDAEQALKSLAKNLARDSASDIGDRHLRAQVRTRYYGQLLTLLRQFDEQRSSERLRYRRLLKSAASAIVLLTASLIGVLMV